MIIKTCRCLQLVAPSAVIMTAIYDCRNNGKPDPSLQPFRPGKSSFVSSCELIFMYIMIFVYNIAICNRSDNFGLNQVTTQASKCCQPLQKMRVRLGACKIDLPPAPQCNFILLIVPRRYFCCGPICFYVLESNFCAV